MLSGWPREGPKMVRRETSPSQQHMPVETEKDGHDLPALQGHSAQDANRKNPIFDPMLMGEHDKLVNMLNPDPLPYQVQRFKSCTALKFVDVPRRHHESFGRTSSSNEPLGRAKAIILHTERFAWDAKPQENISQRDRLTMEQNHVEIAKVMKRRGDVLAHRERHELLLGGEKLPIQDRDMTSREINEVYRSQFSGPALMPVPETRPELRGPEVSLQAKESSTTPEANKENQRDPSLWEPERQTFDNQFNTVSMGVQRALLHARDSREAAVVSAPAPPPARRPSQVPRLPRLPNTAGLTTEMEAALGTARPIGQSKRRGITEMMMGGNRVSLNERADIQSELRRLKSVPLPQTCRELYHGRGIKLPPNHATIKPRLPPPSAEPLGGPAPVPSFTAPESPQAGIQGLKTKSGAPVHISPADATLPAPPENETKEAEDPAKEPQSQPTDEPLPESDQAALEKEQPTDALQPEQRPGSTPLARQTPNPLKGALFKNIHPNVDEDNLLETFKRMDTDMDGHISFSQMESEIPADMTPCEKRFVKEIYDIVSASTFFGSKEFALIRLFCQKVEQLKKELRDAFEETKDIDLHETIVKFVELFQSVDRSNKGEISYESLKYILSTILEKDLEKDAEYLESIPVKVGLVPEAMIEKLDFLTYVPFFISLEPSLQKQFVAERAKTLLE